MSSQKLSRTLCELAPTHRRHKGTTRLRPNDTTSCHPTPRKQNTFKKSVNLIESVVAYHVNHTKSTISSPCYKSSSDAMAPKKRVTQEAQNKATTRKVRLSSFHIRLHLADLTTESPIPSTT